jgi:alkylation response protein AidB-like acyl-CoA dehydrogenase
MRSATPTTEWLDHARRLAPIVLAWRDDGERERQLPQPVYEALRAERLFRLLLPARFAGEAASLDTALAVIEEVSRQDGAAGWNLMIGMTGALFAETLPERGAQEVFGPDPDRPLVGTFAPTGKAVPTDGGHRLSGRWAFASGCQHATWLVAGGIVVDDAPDSGSRPPERRMFVLPAEDCEILDTWTTSGLRGTGSHDFQVADAFVPNHRSFVVVREGESRPGQVSMRSFLAQASAMLAAVALGIARDAIDSFRELASAKTPTGGTTTLGTQHTTHEKVGLAEALVQSTRAFVAATLGEVAAVAAVGGEISEELSARTRLASAFATRSAAEAVDLMYTAGGGSSVYATSRIERCFRDVHMVTQHMAVAPSNIEMAGQYYLGLGLQQRR